MVPIGGTVSFSGSVFGVGLGYRALAVLDGDLAVWFWIGTHADYDRLLRSLCPRHCIFSDTD